MKKATAKLLIGQLEEGWKVVDRILAEICSWDEAHDATQCGNKARQSLSSAIALIDTVTDKE